MGTALPPPNQPNRTEEDDRRGRGDKGREEGDDEYEEEFEDYSGSEDEDKKAEPQSEFKKSVANLMLGGGGGAPQESDPAPGFNSSVIGNKADSLRSYLRGQLSDTEFEKVYALVRSMGECNTEQIQRQVNEVLGPEKGPEQFTLFQLLCFLEDVATTSPSGSMQGVTMA